MTPELEQWRSKAILSGIEKYYNIDYNAGILKGIKSTSEEYQRVKLIVCRLPIPPVNSIENLDIQYKNIVEIPNSVESLFYDCFSRSLAFGAPMTADKIILNEGLKQIEDLVFQNFHNIKEIILPKTVEYIGIGAFVDCKNLRKVIFKNKDTKFSLISFKNSRWYNYFEGLYKIKLGREGISSYTLEDYLKYREDKSNCILYKTNITVKDLERYFEISDINNIEVGD